MTETYGYDKTPTPPRDYDVSKVPAEIKKRATWVKTKFTGEDVAEAYGQAMEITGIYSDQAKQIAQQTKTRQDNLETQTAQSVAQMEADKNTIVANATVDSEVILARGGKPTLQARLDETTARLAHMNTTKTDNGIPMRGAVTFVTDDGGINEYTIFKDIFDNAGVPSCTAINTNTQASNNPNYISIAQAKELQDDFGWEIMSHTHKHINLTTQTESQIDADLSQSVTYLKSNGINIENFSYPFGGINDTARRVVSKHFRGARQSLFGVSGYNESPLDTYGINTVWMDADVVLPAYKGHAINTFSYYALLIDEAVSSGKWLVISYHSGFTGTHNLTQLITDVVNYAAGVGDVITFSEGLNRFGNIVEVGTQESESKRFALGFNGEATTPLKRYSRDKFDGTTQIDKFKKDLISVNNISNAKSVSSGLPGGAGTLFVFSNSEVDVNQFSHRIYKTITGHVYQDALNASGTWENKWKKINSYAIEVPNYYKTGVFNVLDWDDGVVVTSVDFATANTLNLPEKRAGVFTNYKFSKTEHGYSRQEYCVYGSGNTYRRLFGTDGSIQDWEMITTSRITAKNKHNPSSPLADFGLGETVTPVSGAVAVANNAPDLSAGVMKTYKYDLVEHGFNWQTYHVYGTGKSYKRSYDEAGLPKVWEKISAV